MRDAVNKAGRLVIGQVVFGWNKKQKDRIDIGAVNNQQFVQIPTARLKERIRQLCKLYGIEFVETEESYTSKASFLDDDFLPPALINGGGEKPKSWKPSGKRIKRGLYRILSGLLVNADSNACANILRKVSTKLRLNLSGVSRGALTAPEYESKFGRLKNPTCF